MCLKKLTAWADANIKRLRWYDISLIKLSVFAFTLMLAKLCPALLALDWYWYLLISLVVAVPVARKYDWQDLCPKKGG